MTDSATEASLSEAPAEMQPRFMRPQRIAFVQSSWHYDVVAGCREAFWQGMAERGVADQQIDLFEVPGAFEIPLHVQLLAKTRRYTALVAAALVVDGGGRGDELISGAVIQALMDVQLRTEVPVFSAVLTVPQVGAAAEDTATLSRLFRDKGGEVAAACTATLLSLERLRGQVAAGIV